MKAKKYRFIQDPAMSYDFLSYKLYSVLLNSFNRQVVSLSLYLC